MSKDMYEILWHGRGGQGAKTAATMVAHAAMDEGQYSQGFPEYGPERMGAPIRGYTRLSKKPITVHCSISRPDAVVVLDSSLLDAIDVREGADADTIFVLNTKLSPAQVRERLKLEGGKVYTVDATGISIDEIGRPIPNVPVIGALVKATGLCSLESCKRDIKKKFEAKFGSKVVDGNIRALERAHQEVKSED
jgi:pyruvate ferredoxin oxidoreductase gamma subunit